MGSKWDGFTDRSLKILQLANQAAIPAAAREICTDHLLLAILQEGSGIAARALVALGRKPKLLLAQVRATMPPPIQPWEYRKVPFSQLVEDAFVHARREAASLGHSYVGSADLLLGLLRLDSGDAAKFLNDQGITYRAVRDEIVKIIGN
jgi:ATP-dependent Clp protease ATP-binding subunit ClpC